MRTIVLTGALAACVSEPEGPEGSGGDGPVYVLGTMVFGPEGTTSYVSLLDALEPGPVDLAQAREFSGLADVWVHEGAVYVAQTETLTITRFVLQDGALVEQQTVSFADYGLTSLGFWLNTFATPSRAYLSSGPGELIAWDPQRMEIVGTVALPVEEREGFMMYPAYSDRAAVVRDGLLYQPRYWTDDTYFQFAEDSRVAVVDVSTDTVIDDLVVDCPGIDHAAVDERGTIWLSSWVFAPGGAAVLDQPATCAASLSESEPEVAFRVGELTEGREGGALRPLGGGRAVLSVLHDEEAPPSDPPDVAAVTYGPHWRLWSVDLATRQASPLETPGWSSGAQYTFTLDERTYMLVAAGDYTSTTVYDLGADPAQPLLDTPGWSTRLFRLR
jgi:hypothetical protein